MICGAKENLTHGKGLAVEEGSSPEMRRVMYSGGIELFTGGALSGILLRTQDSLQSCSILIGISINSKILFSVCSLVHYL